MENIDLGSNPSIISIDEWDKFQGTYNHIAHGTSAVDMIICNKKTYKLFLRESKRPVLTEKGQYRKSKRKSWRRTKNV